MEFEFNLPSGPQLNVSGLSASKDRILRVPLLNSSNSSPQRPLPQSTSHAELASPAIGLLSSVEATAANPYTPDPTPPSITRHFQYPHAQQPFDTTGQVAPTGAKPRVTATLWEDEGSLCFQVEAKGVCVARREDNHFINGTKLLNVAGMTRGRRDGILKSEKVRHIIKIGPMHLKGVW
jgi:hypothetical protein